MRMGNVVIFVQVVLQIVKFQRLSDLETNRLPIAHADSLLRSFLMEFPIEEWMLIGLRFSEERRQHGNAINLLRRRDAGNFSGCRKEIPEGPDLVADSAGFDFSGPTNHHGDADPALIHISFDTAQGT